MYGDINGGGGKGGRRRGGVVGSADFYRHVPKAKEMTESTKIGVIMSILSIFIMILLFVCETWGALSPKIISSIEIDPNAEQLIRLNFNVTLDDVQCDFVSVDVWDKLGTNLQNVTRDVTKWTIDDQGTRQKFHGRNKHQRALVHEDHTKTALQDISNANGGKSHVTDLSPENSQEFYNVHNLAIVDYFAPWCIWCQRLAPTWEQFASHVKSHDIELGVGKVDCVEHQQMCKDGRVMAFPTIRWYEGGRAIMPDYRGDRTVTALLEHVARRAGSSEGGGAAKERFEEEHHPGCQVSGHVMVNRVPGNLHIKATSTNHAMNSAMTNLTHRVNHLSFGTPHGPQGHVLSFLPFWDHVPDNFKHTNPMKDKFYPTYHFHEAFHHHLKIISTHVEYVFSHSMVLYQILEESQLVFYDVQNVPEIKFLWDISPMGVNLSKERRPWYDYLTSLLAIIGGTFTTLGLINALLLRIFKPK